MAAHNRNSMNKVIIKQGYLRKAPQAKKFTAAFKKKWDRRWFVFGVISNADPYLEYYDNEECIFLNQPINIIDLRYVRHMTYTMQGQKYEFTFNIILPDRVLSLVADTKADMLQWYRALHAKLTDIGVLGKHENDYEVAPHLSSMSPPAEEESEEVSGAMGGSAPIPTDTTSSQRGPRIYRRPTASSSSTGNDENTPPPLLPRSAVQAPVSTENPSPPVFEDDDVPDFEYLGDILNSNIINEETERNGLERDINDEFDEIAKRRNTGDVDTANPSYQVPRSLRPAEKKQTQNGGGHDQWGEGPLSSASRSAQKLIDEFSQEQEDSGGEYESLWVPPGSVGGPVLPPKKSQNGTNTVDPNTSCSQQAQSGSLQSGFGRSMSVTSPSQSQNPPQLVRSQSQGNGPPGRQLSFVGGRTGIDEHPIQPGAAEQSPTPSWSVNLNLTSDFSPSSDDIEAKLAKKLQDLGEFPPETVIPKNPVETSPPARPSYFSEPPPPYSPPGTQPYMPGMIGVGGATSPTTAPIGAISPSQPNLPSRQRPISVSSNQTPAPPLPARSRATRQSVSDFIHRNSLSQVQQSTRNSSTPQRSVSLKESQIEVLRQEMGHPAGVKVSLRKKDCTQGIAFVDCFGKVWIAGWNLKAKPFLHNAFHIGDQLVSINGFVIANSREAHRVIKNADEYQKVSLLVRRVPNAKVYAIKRSAEGESLGFKRESGTAEIVQVDPEGLAASFGLPVKASTMDGQGLCNWVLTEINSRTLNLFFKDNEIEHRLNAVGRDISFMVQPYDFMKALKKQLKTYKNYKEFVLQ